MLRLLYSLIALTGFAGFVSCSKETLNAEGTASLTIVNALLDTSYKALVPSSNNYTAQPQAAVNFSLLKSQYLEFGSQVGQKKLYLYKLKNDNTLVVPAVLNVDLDLPVGYVGSLFIAGTLQQPDTLLVKDSPIYFPPADSSLGLRFVNLAQGGNVISVNIKGQAAGTTISNLPFKNISEFTKYPATSTISSYVFEFRNTANGELLASYTLSDINNPGTTSANVWRYRNFTLVLCGLKGSTTIPSSVFLVRNH